MTTNTNVAELTPAALNIAHLFTKLPEPLQGTFATWVEAATANPLAWTAGAGNTAGDSPEGGAEEEGADGRPGYDAAVKKVMLEMDICDAFEEIFALAGLLASVDEQCMNHNSVWRCGSMIRDRASAIYEKIYGKPEDEEGGVQS